MRQIELKVNELITNSDYVLTDEAKESFKQSLNNASFVLGRHPDIHIIGGVSQMENESFVITTSEGYAEFIEQNQQIIKFVPLMSILKVHVGLQGETIVDEVRMHAVGLVSLKDNH